MACLNGSTLGDFSLNVLTLRWLAYMGAPWVTLSNVLTFGWLAYMGPPWVIVFECYHP